MRMNWGLAVGVAGLGALIGCYGGAADATSTTQVSTQALETLHPAMQQQLAYGNRGHWVMTLQADLALRGFKQVGPTDGIFGPKTESGVKAFQSANHLPVTGVANAVTWQDILAGFHLVPSYSGATVTVAKAAPVASHGVQMTKVPNQAKTVDGRPVLATYHMVATAYGPSLKDNYPYGPVDAFGQPLQAGMIAVDPSIIPLKSTVYVQGYKDSSLPSGGFLGHAMDTGGAIQGHRIDIFMNAGSRTVSNFGVQPVTVYVLGK